MFLWALFVLPNDFISLVENVSKLSIVHLNENINGMKYKSILIKIILVQIKLKDFSISKRSRFSSEKEQSLKNYINLLLKVRLN